MDNTTITYLLGKLFSVAVGFLAGHSIVYVFNRIPAKWLCDYGEEPNKEMWDERIKKQPWDLVFSLVFIASAVKLLNQGPLYLIAGISALWLLLQIGIADKKYMIIPDQYVIGLAVSALGFIPFQSSYLSPLFGALIGGGSFFLIGTVGKWILKKDAMGFGDVKLLASVGLMVGMKGILIVLIIIIFSSAIILGLFLLTRRIERGEEQPLGPFIVASTAAYILFQQEILFLVDWYLNLY